jgi:hypothetical protein
MAPNKKLNAKRQAKREARKARRELVRAEAVPPSSQMPSREHTFDTPNRDGHLPRSIQTRLSDLAASVAAVSTEHLLLVPNKPGPDDETLMCIQNVLSAVERQMGEAAYGWTLDIRISEHGPYVFLQHHAVLRTCEGALVDVTPQTPRHLGRTLYIRGQMLFLPNSTTLPMDSEYGPASLPNRFTSLRQSEALKAYLAELTRKALSQPQTLNVRAERPLTIRY